MKKKRKILDHPVLGYFVLYIIGLIFVSMCCVIDSIAAAYIPGYGIEMEISGRTINNAMGFGVAIGSIFAIVVFSFWFKPDYKGGLSFKNFKTGLLMLLPCLLIQWFGSVISIITVGLGNVFLAFLKAMAPGFGEEMMFRILGISNFMRTIKTEKDIKKIFWLSSIVFGIVHMTNVFVGADMFTSICQSVYAVGIGMILGAVYLRTGNAWVIMLGHMSLDFTEFCRADLGNSNGVMQAMGVGDWITIVAGIVGGVIALRLLDKKYYPEIMDLWNRKWNR